MKCLHVTHHILFLFFKLCLGDLMCFQEEIKVTYDLHTFHSHSSFTLINIFGTGVILTVTNILSQAHLETNKEKLVVDSLSLGNEFKVHNYVNVEKKKKK